jgi:hypothetical protein
MNPPNNPPQEGGRAETGADAILAEQFVMLADTPVDDYDMIDLLDRLVHASV